MRNLQQTKRFLLVSLAMVAFASGAFIQLLRSTQPFGPAFLAGIFLGSIFVGLALMFIWYRLDAKQRGFECSVALNIAVVVAALLALPYYFFRSRGLRGGSIATLLFLLAAAAWFVFFRIGAITIYTLVQRPHAEVAFSPQGEPDGIYKLYDSSGQLQITGEFHTGKREGVWTIWDPGGGKRVELMYRDGVKEGPCRMWYGSSEYQASAGQKKLEVAFVADKQNGSKRSWWANGKPRCEPELDHGLIVSTRCWSESGNEFSAAKSIELARDELELDARYLDTIDEEVIESIKRAL
jgi:hypothetical protein